jgi:hypothetical protein
MGRANPVLSTQTDRAHFGVFETVIFSDEVNQILLCAPVIIRRFMVPSLALV